MGRKKKTPATSPATSPSYYQIMLSDPAHQYDVFVARRTNRATAVKIVRALNAKALEESGAHGPLYYLERVQGARRVMLRWKEYEVDRVDRSATDQGCGGESPQGGSHEDER